MQVRRRSIHRRDGVAHFRRRRLGATVAREHVTELTVDESVAVSFLPTRA